jgi:hypothetical protein
LPMTVCFCHAACDLPCYQQTFSEPSFPMPTLTSSRHTEPGAAANSHPPLRVGRLRLSFIVRREDANPYRL